MQNKQWRRQEAKIKQYQKDRASHLQTQMHQFVAFLKETKVSLNDAQTKNLYDSPWFLMMGPSQAGKTSLLAHSNLNFVFRKKDPQKRSKNSEVNWWATKNAIIIDTPGDYFNLFHRHARLNFRSFLSVLKRECPKKRLAGLIIVLDQDQLIQSNKKEEKILHYNIKQAYQETTKIFKQNIPTYLIVNQVDRLPGFHYFFNDISQEEREQHWGFLLNDQPQTFKTQFSSLQNRLQSRLIHRLQHEKTKSNRFKIQQFPLALSRLEAPIQILLNVCKKQHTTITGFFFTATTPCDHQNNLSTLPTTTQNSQFSAQRHFTHHSFFVDDLFAKLIFQKINANFDQPHHHHKKWLAIICSFFILTALSTLGFTHLFLKKSQQLNHAQQSLLAYEQLSNDHHNTQNQLAALSYLKQSTAILDSKHHKNNPTIHKAQAKIFLPLIQKSLEKILNNPKTPLTLRYQTLKAYLMFSTADHFNQLFLSRFFNHYRTLIFNNPTNDRVLSELTLFLNTPPKSFNSNADIIEANRNILQALSPDERLPVLLEDLLLSQPKLALNLNQNKQAAEIFGYQRPNLPISSLFTQNSFDQTYSKQLKQITKEAISGNWIIGSTPSISTKNHQALLSSAQEQYLSLYAKSWSQFIDNIELKQQTSLTQATKTLALLSGESSPLFQLTDLMKDNLPDAALKQDAHLQALADTMGQPDFQAEIKTRLSDLQHYLTTIIGAKNPSEQNFKKTAYRMRNNGQNDPLSALISTTQQLPEPLQHWLYQLANNVWQLQIDKAQQYMAEKWQTEIKKQYQNQIAGHFPFNPQANTDVNFSAFEYFFAPKGLFDQFFSNYLTPFIETSKRPWQSKNVDGITLSLSNTVLKQLQTIADIRKIYFNDSQHIHVPFVLQPLNIENNIQSLSVTLGAQKMRFNNRIPFEQKRLIWPDNHHPENNIITLKTDDDQTITLREKGNWGFLKLLNQAGLKTTQQHHIYEATFDQDGYFAKLGFAFDQPENPFNLKRFSQFHLPDLS